MEKEEWPITLYRIIFPKIDFYGNTIIRVQPAVGIFVSLDGGEQIIWRPGGTGVAAQFAK